MNTASTDFGLNAAEQELIAQRIIQSGELTGLEQQTGDFRTALERAVQGQIWLDPYFREKAIAADNARKGLATTSEATAERKAASSSVAGTVGSVARETAPARPGSRQEAIDAMAKVIAADMGRA